MGATVTTGKLAAVYEENDGTPMYVLFEETYEKNVHPHVPRWETIAIGSISVVLPRVFRYAAATVGGMLQGRSGRISPTAYIKGWMEALAHPKAFPGKGRVAIVDITPEALEGAERIGARTLLARMKEAQASAAKVINLDFCGDAPLLVDAAMVMPPWRIAPGYACPEHGPQAEEHLAWRPGRSRDVPDIGNPGVYRFANPAYVNRTGKPDDSDCIVVRAADGALRSGKKVWSFLEDFVAQYGPIEYKHPGQFASSYRKLKTQLDALPKVPESTRLRVDHKALDLEENRWYREICARADQFLGEAGRPLSDARQNESVRRIVDLPGVIVFDVPEEDRPEEDAGAEDRSLSPA